MHQSQVNKNNAEAAAALLTAVKEVPFFATKMGSLVIIKITNPEGNEQVVTRLLTTAETVYYDQHPELLNNPIQLLNHLGAGQVNGL